MTQHKINTSQKVSDEVKKTTCYMCACRCGINVHMCDGKVRYIEGNRDHPVNQGVLCAKGSAGIMQHYAPSRLNTPMRRVGERGEGKFEPISWEEALSTATEWLAPIRKDDPSCLAFFTGRDQSQGLTGWWAQQFGTQNFAAHGGFCSVNMAAAGIYTMGGAFWEFGSPDWERTKLFMIFGVAEDHDSNPIKMGLSRLKEREAKIIAVNPVRTGYNAIADEWVGITPGTDGLFVLALIHELMGAGKVDIDYLCRYTNAPWLVIDNPGGADDGLFARNEAGEALIWDKKADKPCAYSEKGITPEMAASVSLADGRRARPVFALMADKYLDDKYSPEAVAEATGIPTSQIKSIAYQLAKTAFEEEIVIKQKWTDWKGETHSEMRGRPVSFHAMRGISAHSNGFQTCRSIHLLQILLGSVECPGGFRFKPPYPKPSSAHPAPGRPKGPETPLSGPPLGYIHGPEDLLVEADGSPQRIDKAYSWDAPFSAHGMMHMVISNAYAGDPYPVDVLFMYMANMSWNSSMNSGGVMEMLKAKNEDGEYVIPKIIYSDAYESEMVAFADLILPDTTYLERHDCISLLDRPICEPDAVADSIRWPVVEPDRDVRGFQSVLLELGGRLGLNGMTGEDGKPLYKDYADYIINHQRKPGIGPLAGFRGEDGSQSGRGDPNPGQLDAYIDNGGFWSEELPEAARFYKHANQDYQDWAVKMGFFDAPQPVTFQLWLEPLAKFQLAANGHGEHIPPEHIKEQIKACFDPLPDWYAPFEGERLDNVNDYPYHAITQRPAAMYHSWGSQNSWLRQIHTKNPLYVPGPICDEAGLVDDDWAWVSSHHGRIKVQIKRMEAVNNKTMWTWNAIGKRRGAWALSPDAPEAKKGFLLNHLIHELLPGKGDGLRWSNSDPITGQAAWYDLRVNIEKAEVGEGVSEPAVPAQEPLKENGQTELRYGQEWTS
ncbi:MAG: molybdopterin oxidoreductase family protein [Alphaproteobacteria bacterium]|nr:molybdopterin oxidoreductase family protein [Alphaproteobacteria bacterium]MBL6776400.1 molybdopterin oxidoreductase family protein [Alphaproteobacteria bacterium]